MHSCKRWYKIEETCNWSRRIRGAQWKQQSRTTMRGILAAAPLVISPDWRVRIFHFICSLLSHDPLKLQTRGSGRRIPMALGHLRAAFDCNWLHFDCIMDYYRGILFPIEDEIARFLAGFIPFAIFNLDLLWCSFLD